MPMKCDELPLPSHFDPGKTGDIFRVPYYDRAREALEWARSHRIGPSSEDRFRIALLAIDVQNTFCIPGFELYVAGPSGNGAVEDTARLCRFIYRNLQSITEIVPTMDTHRAMQIFHPLFFINSEGAHPDPMTVIPAEDLRNGIWRASPHAAALTHGGDYGELQQHVLHYAEALRRGGKYELMIWPYHAMLGGIGHALVPAFEEALFFHGVCRSAQASFELKGGNALTENYSVLSPEIREGPGGEPLAEKNRELITRLLGFDAVIIAGEAKSHCVAWTVDDLLGEIEARDASLAGKVYLLEDCTSPVVVPGVADFSHEADKAFSRFRKAGMHLVSSGEPMASWPGIPGG
ncbi:MAG: cysteine hydrolase family protein [Candidatus Eremiobacteraeota bacterium]|nr:cysteine hydrolase family protein [Candidatus Eremiobacteraeota bacterium]